RQTLRLDGAPCPGGGQCKGGRCTCSILGDTANCPSGEICDHDGSGGHACYPKCRVGYVGDCGRGTACGPVFDVSDNFVGGRCAPRKSGARRRRAERPKKEMKRLSKQRGPPLYAGSGPQSVRYRFDNQRALRLKTKITAPITARPSAATAR